LELTPEELEERADELESLARPCHLCPRECRAEREVAPGFCRQPLHLLVPAVCAHHGEEPPLSGSSGGAGTVFLAGCTMRCTFCQNHQISDVDPCRAPARWRLTVGELARRMRALEAAGCHNVELVSPTSHLPSVVRALARARAEGLSLPVVYNTNGYDRVEVLRLLEGVVSVYLPDAKYGSDELALRLSGTPGYVGVNRAALLEMWRQVGPLEVDGSGLARRGLVVRHLVLPGHLEDTALVLAWLAGNLGGDVTVSLMAQYAPAHRTAAPAPGGAAAAGNGGLSRRLTRREYRSAVEHLLGAGLERGWVQELASSDLLRPDFFAEKPFGRCGP
jgi:putative pyruvate formate lyase activating enzyme